MIRSCCHARGCALGLRVRRARVHAKHDHEPHWRGVPPSRDCCSRGALLPLRGDAQRACGVPKLCDDDQLLPWTSSLKRLELLLDNLVEWLLWKGLVILIVISIPW
jgi:hypothetical protein